MLLHKTSSIAPDAGAYELEFVRYSDIVQMSDYNDDTKMVDKIYLTFVPVNFDYDEDVDTRDWNGVEFDVLFKVSLHKKSSLGPVVAALSNVASVDDLPGDVNLDDLKGRRINATISKTPGGYAKIEGPSPVRRKKKATAAPAQSNVFLEDDDE